MSKPVPESHQDLLLRPIHGVLTTMMPDGQPQMSIVWADFDGEHILINTTIGRQKGKNMVANPLVNLLLIDPLNGARFLEIRGHVSEVTQEGAISHADQQTRAYSNNTQRHFYGDVYPIEKQQEETRVIVRISPTKISTDAFFN